MKYIELMQVLRSQQPAIEKKYLDSLDKINKEIFANKSEINISTKGLFKFKVSHYDEMRILLKKNKIFSNLEKDELKYIIDNYLNEMFVMPFRIVLKP